MTKEATLFSVLPMELGLNMVPKFLAEEAHIPNTGPLDWRPGADRTGSQRSLIEMLPGARQSLGSVGPDECFAAAAWTAEEINQILKDEGHGNIKLRPWDDPETFGVAGGVLFDWYWKTPGGGTYKVLDWRKGSRFASGVSFFTFEERVVAAIPTQRKSDFVFVAEAGNYVSRFALIEECTRVHRGMQATTEYEGAILPQWAIEPMQVDVSDLVGLNAQDSCKNPRIISQAVFGGENSFRRDGTHFKAAFAAAAMKGGLGYDEPGPKDWVAETDLIVWYVRKGASQLLGAVYAPTDIFSREEVYR